MPRIARKNLDTSFLHVMVQGVNKEYIFSKEKYIVKYLELINRFKNDKVFSIIAYCMMNNHAHFLMYVEDINEFGKVMHKVNLLYTQMYNKEEKRCGVLFRNRYKTEPIYDIKYLVNCIKYIHKNPVKAKMVSKCEDYKYSSYNDYIRNCGVSQNKILKEIFGKECDYNVIFRDAFDKKFIDIEDTCVNEYIVSGINEFKKENNVNLIDILSDREVLKKLIYFLKEDCGIKYVEIRNYFNIPRGTMDELKRIVY